MGTKKLLPTSISTMTIFLCMFTHINAEEAFPFVDGTYPSEAEGPTAESSDMDELELNPGPPPRVVDVDDYRERADDDDHTEAFLQAWKEACNSSDYPSVLLVPEGKTYLLMPVSFNGPCRATTITATIRGTLEAPSNRSVWLDRDLQEWITFDNIDHLRVVGGGTINGNGHEWWINSCKTNQSMQCVSAGNLQALYFRRCNHLVVEGLQIIDSMQMHVVIAYSWRVLVSRLLIAAPGWSPNTDGIHVSNSREVLISGCIISTGDDCISIVTGSMFVRATGIFCGPGHGISIGSLGANKSWAHVSDVLVEKATLVGTTNGVRIKTWQGGDGYAERITFQDISMHNVTNPVIIDQNYCDSKTPCHEQGSAVAINNIRYRNIRGTSSSKIAINFVCSNSVHCDGIVMQDVSLVGEGTYVSCSYMNARVVELGYNFPYCRAEM
uniref:Pectate lyase superfamily protein domain-containing protein n=1 Tax=Leersia perrieri TaxID=77586 RepID=A0A0D9VRA2_9ORYZ